ATRRRRSDGPMRTGELHERTEPHRNEYLRPVARPHRTDPRADRIVDRYPGGGSGAVRFGFVGVNAENRRSRGGYPAFGVRPPVRISRYASLERLVRGRERRRTSRAGGRRDDRG